MTCGAVCCLADDRNLELASALSRGFFDRNCIIVDDSKCGPDDIIARAVMIRGEDAAVHARVLGEVRTARR